MNDIKLSELGNIDYIPEDEILCTRCIHYSECPYHYVCKSIERLREYMTEIEEI